MSKLSERVQEWLSQQERNQAYLARKAGIDESYLSMILSGQRKPGPRALAKLEKAMGLRVGTLERLRSQTQLPMEEVNNGHVV